MIKISSQSPAPGTTNNDTDTLITFVIEKKDIDVSKVYIGINGDDAFKDSSFQSGYDGLLSSFSVETDSASFTIQKTEAFDRDENITVKVYYSDPEGNDEESYSFKTHSNKPVLYFSNISSGETLECPVIIRLEFVDEYEDIDLTSFQLSINGSKIVLDGVVSTSYPDTEISSILNGCRLDFEPPEFLRNGNYTINYQIADIGGATLIDEMKFSVKLKTVILPETFPESVFLNQISGLKKAVNQGDGKSIKLEWSKMFSRVPKSEVFGLLYYGNDRLKTFDSQPKILFKSDINEYTYDKFTTGLIYYLALRGMETFKDTFDLNGMVQLDTSAFEIPNETSVVGVFDTSDLSLIVADTTGYPDKGLLVINNKEVVKYTSITRSSNTFNIPANGRGLNNTSRGFFTDGDEVKLFVSCQDSNNNILKSVPDFSGDQQSGRTVNNIGVLVTDYTDNDKKFFEGFDYCGYHQPLPNEVLEGIDDCGSYLGGEFNKHRGMNIYDRMLDREEVLLEQVGEPVILLKRKWEGETCRCTLSRTMNPKEKTCQYCFGTTVVGGYDQYFNKRRNDKRILVRFRETAEDLEIHASKHLTVKYEPQAFTLPIPAVRDRDIIVRFDYTDDLEYFYEVLDVNKEKVIYKHFGRQNLRLKRLDKTDLINTFKFTK